MKFYLYALTYFITTANLSAATESSFAPKYIFDRIKTQLSTSAERNFTKKSLCFTSAESSHNLGTVTNCVKKFPDKSGELWLMRQDVDTKDRLIKNLIATYVEQRPNQKPLSYFFELDRNEFDQKGSVSAIRYKVPCVMCHSSGPRLIRPTVESLKSLNDSDSELLKNWNRSIIENKSVETFYPNSNEASFLVPKPNLGHEILKIPACYQCHNSQTGVRAELSLNQFPSIYFLTYSSTQVLGHAQMPTLDSPELTKEETRCLDKWLNRESAKNCEVSEATNEHIAKRINEIKVLVQTNFHSFEISNLPIAESTNQFQIDISHLKTGITARDEHTKKLLNASSYPFIFAQLEQTIPNDKTHFKIPMGLTILDHKKSVDVLFDCNAVQSQCNFEADVDLSRWGLKMPSFLGIEVSPKISVKGHFGLERSPKIEESPQLF